MNEPVVIGQHRLALSNIAEAASRIDPVFLRSPQFVCEPIALQLGCSLTLKVETINPIRSFKGRGADYFVGKLDDRGPLTCASAGNFGQAMAYACRKRGIALTVFAAQDANPLKVSRMRSLGAEVHLVGGDFESAKQAARASGGRFVEDGFDAQVSEGAGTIAVELLARDESFDAVVVPLGDGALLNGIARWIKSASPATRVIGACSRGAPAMYHAWKGEVVDAHPDTIADGIWVRAPVTASVADMRGLVDDVALVADSTLIDAMRLVYTHAGLVTEPAGVAGLAAIIESRDAFAGLRVATVLSGGNLTSAQMRAWIEDRGRPNPNPKENS